MPRPCSFDLREGGWSGDTETTNFLDLTRSLGARPQEISFFAFPGRSPRQVIDTYAAVRGMSDEVRFTSRLGSAPAVAVDAEARPARG